MVFKYRLKTLLMFMTYECVLNIWSTRFAIIIYNLQKLTLKQIL